MNVKNRTRGLCADFNRNLLREALRIIRVMSRHDRVGGEQTANLDKTESPSGINSTVTKHSDYLVR